MVLSRSHMYKIPSSDPDTMSSAWANEARTKFSEVFEWDLYRLRGRSWWGVFPSQPGGRKSGDEGHRLTILTSQSLMELSRELVKRYTSVMSTEVTSPTWAVRVRMLRPDTVSQNRM